MAQTQKGRLKIFFSYAEGAGKRTAMRKAGLQERKRGRDPRDLHIIHPFCDRLDYAMEN